MSTIEFSVGVHPGTGGAIGVEPRIDGELLSAIVDEFDEARNRRRAPGDFGPLVTSYFRFGPLFEYFLGEPENDYWIEQGKVAVLGCGHCGEVGCWPLYAEVTATPSEVRWAGFEVGGLAGSGPDYGGLGPFAFARPQYEAALRRGIAALG